MGKENEIFLAADAAGKVAVEKLYVRPMIVGQPKNVFGNDVDLQKPVYYVAEGVCGYASVNIKPANCKFAKFLVGIGLARKDSYRGGVYYWVSDYNQSLQKKEAYAYAFADVLRDNGIRAYADSRMD